MGVTADADGVIAVSYREVQSLDPTDGSTSWHAAIGRTPDIAPVRAAIDADLVAVPTSDRCRRARHVPTGSPAGRRGYGDAVADAGPRVASRWHAGTGRSSLVLGTTERGAVAAFDRATGAIAVDGPRSPGRS